MRILFLFGEISEGSGGIQGYSRHLLKAVCASPVVLDAEVLLLRGSPGITALLTPPASQGRIRIRAGGPRPSGLSKVRWATLALGQAVFHRPDAVWCGHVNFLPVALTLHYGLRLPFILETHAWELALAPRGILSRGIRRARMIHAASRFTKDLILSIQPVDASKIRVLPRPADFNTFTPGPAPPELLERLHLSGKRVLLTVGRLASTERYKGHAEVIHAVKILAPKFTDLRYVIVGEGDDRARLERAAQEDGVRDRVVFAGPAGPDECVGYYRACDVFVMPSRFEGFGIVYLEALACGKPVIAGNGDGSRDALLDGRLGLLVNPLSPPEIAAAIESILDKRVGSSLTDPAVLRETARENFSFEVFGERVKENLAYLWPN
ncbi:MAG: glycosyltransferase family 4 protein [Nitrospirae bacterium]|nr:glycosyltransferase family 4 protein [Nitrospirota bacterium]